MVDFTPAERLQGKCPCYTSISVNFEKCLMHRWTAAIFEDDHQVIILENSFDSCT